MVEDKYSEVTYWFSKKNTFTYIIILCVKSKSSKYQTVKKLWVGTISDRNIPKYDKQDLLKGTCIFCGTN